MIEKTYSHQEALAYVCWLLRQRTYQAQLSAGTTWQDANRKAQRWSPLGKAGTLFSVDEEIERCFDAEGNLVAPLEFAWQGDLGVIRRAVEVLRFDVTVPVPELQTDTAWARLTVSSSEVEAVATPQGRQATLDTVVKINNARRLEEMVCCILEDQKTHIVLLARRFHNVFQVKIALDEQWHIASLHNVWRVASRQQKSSSQPA